MITSSIKSSCDHSESISTAIFKVDLTAEDNGCSPEVSLVERDSRDSSVIQANSRRDSSEQSTRFKRNSKK